ncbi:hypothetical protein BJ322DRAFT_1211220 [Thelephora terrestris]|uniref:Uncharacterized protein n=1 Tax=Thelephora terrestris TaxID=56493 RepID=A0A9P6HFY5_9AGAM|nr:hypothetical protein BJ322DRAFT_1211220 [Thelephora terrestris]
MLELRGRLVIETPRIFPLASGGVRIPSITPHRDTSNMSQEPVEVTPPSILDQEQGPLLEDDETGSLAYTSESIVVLPKPSEGFPQHQKTLRQRVWRWISRPSVKVFIALFIVAVLSLGPSLLSSGKDLTTLSFGLIPTTQAPPDESNCIYMNGVISDFDWSGTQTLSLVWSPFRTPLEPPEEVPSNDTHTWNAAHIYINNVSDPVYHYAPINTTFVTPDESPQNNVYVSPFETRLNAIYSDQFYFPEDECVFEAIIFVLDEATNKSVPITGFSFSSSGLDFDTEHDLQEVSLKIVYDTVGGPTAEWIQASYMIATIKHGPRARAITYSMFVINWILTLSSTITTVSVIFHRRGVGKDTVALLPITVILTIPVIRSLYAGSPPYGILLDMVGFFPQLLIVAACAVAVLSGFALQSIHSESTPHGKEE